MPEKFTFDFKLPEEVEVGKPAIADLTGSQDTDGQIESIGVSVDSAPMQKVGVTLELPGQYRITGKVKFNATGKLASETKTLTVVPATSIDVAPQFTQHPQSQTVQPGGQVTLTVAVTGTPMPTLQWFADEGDGWVALEGETADSLVLSLLETVSLKCVASNPAGIAESDVAVITVVEVATLPVFTLHPVSQTILQGQVAAPFVVAVTGTPTPTLQWLLNGAPIAGATGTSYVPTTAGAYACVATNSAGLVTSNAATLVITIPVPTNGVVPASWIKYRGAALLPSSFHMIFASGGVALHTVNGEKRFLVMGSEAEANSPIYEFADPLQYSLNPHGLPRAAARRQWLSPYGGKRGAFLPDGTFFEFPMNFANNQSIIHVPETGLVYVTYDELYGVAGGVSGPNPNLLGIRLLDNGQTEVHGPWRLAGVDGDGEVQRGARWTQWLCRMPDGTMGGACGWSSGNRSFSWGPSLAAGAPWPMPSTPAGYGLDYLLPQRLLRYYCMLGMIDGPSGMVINNGDIWSFRKRFKPHFYEYYPGVPESSPGAGDGVPPDSALWVNPAHYGGMTSWSETDSTKGVLVLPDVAGKSMALFCGAQCDAHTWYQSHLKPVCPSHGVPPPLTEHGTPLQNTGPTATHLYPYLAAYDLAKLEQVRQGLVDDWRVEPEWVIDVSELGAWIAPSGWPSGGGFEGFAWDPERRMFFCIAHRAETNSAGQPVWGSVLHAFEIVPE